MVELILLIEENEQRNANRFVFFFLLISPYYCFQLIVRSHIGTTLNIHWKYNSRGERRIGNIPARGVDRGGGCCFSTSAAALNIVSHACVSLISSLT